MTVHFNLLLVSSVFSHDAWSLPGETGRCYFKYSSKNFVQSEYYITSL